MKKAVALTIAGAAALIVAGWRRVQRDNSIATDPQTGPDGSAAGAATSGSPAAAPGVNVDADRTRAELYEIAQDLGIEGRSTMNKAELLSAIRSAD